MSLPPQTRAEGDKKILSIAFAYASRVGLRREEAEDCAVEFLEHIYRMPAPIPSSAWLCRCAHNYANNYVRTLSRRRQREQTLSERFAHRSDLVLNAQPSNLPGPKTLFLRKELWQQLGSALKQLTPTQQALFVRYHLRNNSIQDLAARYGRTPHAIEESLSHIRKRLGQLLQRQGWTEQDATSLFRNASRTPAAQPER